MRSQHFVQLFDESASLSDAVADFVAEGLTGADRVLLAMTYDHWLETKATLVGRGVNVEAAVYSGRLVVRDASATMRHFVRKGRPQQALFDNSVGMLVSTLASYGPLRIYGEMVDVLAAEGDLSAALELEQVWNDLGERQPFTLFCGYSAVNFGNPMTAPVLRSICRAHSHVVSDSRDALATFLLSEADPAAGAR
jgi:hypothetical protein